jgi:hypothetical protein
LGGRQAGQQFLGAGDGGPEDGSAGAKEGESTCASAAVASYRPESVARPENTAKSGAIVGSEYNPNL